MCKILIRIKTIADAEGITIGALERQIGASKGVLSRAINNGTDIQAKWVVAIVENYPQYSAQWLLSGQGPMKLNDELQHETHETPTDNFMSFIQVIREQSEEIGRLKQRIIELERNARRAPNLVSVSTPHPDVRHAEHTSYQMVEADITHAAEP